MFLVSFHVILNQNKYSQVQAGKNCPFSCQGFLSGFMYLRPHYLKNTPGPPQILPQIQDGGQKSNMADKIVRKIGGH